ncbi:MAG: gliding motility-associated C-terminal domain-containing protein [Chitinophagaceae bacterium]
MKYFPLLLLVVVLASAVNISLKDRKKTQSATTGLSRVKKNKKGASSKKTKQRTDRITPVRPGGNDAAFDPCPFKNDFSFNLDPCNPLRVSFSTNAAGYDSIRWYFGDGNTIDNTINPVNVYASQGNYTVSMITHYIDCSDTAVRTISVNTLPDASLIRTSDTVICFGSTKQIHASPGTNFCWSPTTYLDDPASPDPVTSTPETITYHLQTLDTGTNIIVNGNFSAGNTGFTSQYLYSPSSGFNAGVYNVGSNIQAWHSGFANCTDHTTGNGNLLMVNGAGTPDVSVWSEGVSVAPNTNYEFSVWVESLVDHDPATLQFSINGNNLGDPFFAPSVNCEWERFYIIWNSGSNTTATISIVNQNTTLDGNDFALDDISFSPIFIRQDDVTITVDTARVKALRSSAICAKDTVQLNATGGVTYSWSPAAGLNNAAIADPRAFPLVTTQYLVTGTNANGCTARDSVLITVNPLPTVQVSDDTIICSSSQVQLFASGGTRYLWSPAGSLNNNQIANPVATPAASTVYHVTVFDANNCSNTDSVKVELRSGTTFSITQPGPVCKNVPVQLLASGGDAYLWSPSAFLDNATIANPTATTASTTAFSVLITDMVCHHTETLNATVTILPDPPIKAGKSNDIDCSHRTSNLSAAGGSNYLWSPAASLDDPSSINPVASPLVTTTYLVTGKGSNGCTGKDSVTVLVSAGGSGSYYVPSAFTPNGDGKNDCFGLKNWGGVTDVEFSIYNRWGERIFFTSNPSVCWDGTVGGVKQNPGIFVYMIKAKSRCDGAIFRKGTVVLIR